MQISHWLALLPLAALSQDAEAPGYDFTFQFGWPAEGKILVHDVGSKGGKEVAVDFTMRWAPDEESGWTKLEMVDFNFLRFDGNIPGDPAFEQVMRMIRPMTSVTPALYINEEGALVEIGNMDEALERLAELIGTSIGEQEAKLIRNMFAQPQMQAQVQSSVNEDWNAWGGFWNGFEADFDTEFVLEAGGTSVFPEWEISIGARETYRGVECVRAMMTSVADPDRLMLAMSGMMDLIAASSDDERAVEGLAKARSMFEEVSRVDSFGGLYALADLRPLVISTSMDISIKAKGEAAPQTELETHEYTFEWPDLEPATSGD